MLQGSGSSATHLVGSTVQHRVFGFWGDSNQAWNETNFKWGTTHPGEIWYPYHHVDFTQDQTLYDSLNTGWINDGTDANQTDPIDRTPDSTKDGAIWVTKVKSGRSGTRLKVEKDN